MRAWNRRARHGRWRRGSSRLSLLTTWSTRKAWNALLQDDYDAFLAARGEAVRQRLSAMGVSVGVAAADEAADDENEIVDDDGQANDLGELED